MDLIIQLISGAVGGWGAGLLMKKFSLGTIWDCVLGILGGGLGAQLLGLLGVQLQGGADLGGIVSNIATGGVGGGALLAIVGLIKQAVKK